MPGERHCPWTIFFAAVPDHTAVLAFIFRSSLRRPTGRQTRLSSLTPNTTVLSEYLIKGYVRPASGFLRAFHCSPEEPARELACRQGGGQTRCPVQPARFFAKNGTPRLPQKECSAGKTSCSI